MKLSTPTTHRRHHVRFAPRRYRLALDYVHPA